MRGQMKVERQIAVRMTAPSPLAGEGYADGRPKLDWVRGCLPEVAMWRQPLTRLRFAKADAKHRRPNLRTAAKAAYASPTRGEGKRPAQVGTSTTVPMTAPSPLAGEGITADRPTLDWVRGCLPDVAMWRQPLTRLRFAKADAKHRRPNLRTAAKAAYASPTGGEGKKRGQSA